MQKLCHTARAAGALLLVLAIHSLALWHWWQPPTPASNQPTADHSTVLNVVLLPAPDASSDSSPPPPPPAPRRHAKVAPKNRKTAPQPRQAAAKPRHSKPPDSPLITAQQPASTEPAHAHDVTPALPGEATASPLEAAPYNPEAAADNNTHVTDAPVAESPAPEPAPDEDHPDTPENHADALLPDMREAISTGLDRSPGREQVASGMTDDDWLGISPAPSVRLITPQERHHNPRPIYPALSQRLHEEGTVHLRATINAQGQVIALRIIQSSGFALLDRAARDTVLHWRLTPPRNAGKTTEAAVDIPVIFRLTEL